MPISRMTPRENQVLETALAILKKELDPSKIILFGSRAEGRSVPGSDFDLAVDSPKPERAREIKEAVNESVGLFKVDIVYLPNIEPDFRSLVLKTGKIVYERKA